MRVPLYIVIPACLLIIAFVWWQGTRHLDFLTPPSEARLETIRSQAQASLSASGGKTDAISIRVPNPDLESLAPEPVKTIEPQDIGDLSKPVRIDSYTERTADGAAKLLSLAEALETRAEPQRALLAYERVLDLSQPNPEQIQDALIAIRRIKPTLPPWNAADAPDHRIVIHLGTGETFAEVLPGIMDQVSSELAAASSGLLCVSHRINIGSAIQPENSATPIALWITGEDIQSVSTDVLSFTSDDPSALHDQLLKTIFNLIRSHIAKATPYNPAPEPTVHPSLALNSNITRLLWLELGKSLNPKPTGQ